jgi:hypothetical protein
MRKSVISKKILVSPRGRSANASRNIPAKKAAKKSRGSLNIIVKHSKHRKTRGSGVNVPSRKTAITRSKNKR